jgi:ribosomal protein S18 acetylase RimI-like enzyme
MENTEVNKKDNVSIRDFRKSDLNDLLDLLPRCFAREFEITGFDPVHMREVINRAYGMTGRLFLGTSRLLGKEPIRFLVADLENRIVGTTMVDSRERVGYISSVMVSPDHRRRGIATSLVKSANDYIRRRGMDRAVLHAVSTNVPAIGVYSKLGFEPFEQIAHLVGDSASMPAQTDTDGVEVRPFRGTDLNDVYNLTRASQEPNHLKVLGLSKKQLKTPLWLRLFNFSTQKRMVAVRDDRIVGSVVAAYTTPKEVGNISSVQVKPEDRSQGIEKALVAAASNEIKKGGVGRILATVPTSRQELIDVLTSLGFKETMVLVGMFKETR